MNTSRNHARLLALALVAGGFLALGPAGPATSSYAGTPGRIFFSSDRAGGQDIWSMNADGTRLARLTTDGSSTSPSISPDGTRVAFISGGDLWTMDIDGTGRVAVTDTVGVEQSPTWSPDGTRLAYVSTGGSSDGNNDSEIFVRNADGTGGTSQLTANSFPDIEPSWSPPLPGHPAGRIAFVSARTGDTDRNVYVMDVSGGNVANLTPYGTHGGLPYQGHDDDPSWSPDGRIAYTHTFQPNAGGLPAVWVIDADGGGRQRLSTDSTTSATDPAWSPDGLHLAFVGTVGTDRNIGVMTVAGHASHIDVATSHDISPEWQEDSVDPTTSLGSTPPDPTTETTAALELVSNEPGSTFECRLDHGTFAACTSPYALSGLGLGSHTVEVRAVDPVGRPDPTPATHTWTVVEPEPVPVPVPVPDPPAAPVAPVAPPVPTAPSPAPVPVASVDVAKRVVLGRTGGVVAVAVGAGQPGSRVTVKVQAKLQGAWKVIGKRAWTSTGSSRPERVRVAVAPRWLRKLGDSPVKAQVTASATSPAGVRTSAVDRFRLSR